MRYASTGIAIRIFFIYVNSSKLIVLKGRFVELMIVKLQMAANKNRKTTPKRELQNRKLLPIQYCVLHKYKGRLHACHYRHCREMAVTNLTEDENQKKGLEEYCSFEFSGEVRSLLISLSVVMIILSIATFLANTLILVALHKESSLLSPPFASRVLYRNLAITDLCVGVIAEPMYIAYLMFVVNKSYNNCHYTRVTCYFITSTLSALTFYTLTAISVDRLLVLSLGLRYRQAASSKRKVVTVICLWIFSIVRASPYSWNPSIARQLDRILSTLCITTKIFCYTKIFFCLRRNQIQVHTDASQGQPGQTVSLNKARYRKAVYSALWVQVTMVVCYVPVSIVVAMTPEKGPVPISLYLARQLTVTLVYLNSSLNPLLYSWKIREVRQAMKVIIRQLLCLAS